MRTTRAVPLDLTIAADQIRCQTADYFPRKLSAPRVTFNNKVEPVYESTARVDVLAEAVFSTDGGAELDFACPDSQTYQTLER